MVFAIVFYIYIAEILSFPLKIYSLLILKTKTVGFFQKIKSAFIKKTLFDMVDVTERHDEIRVTLFLYGGAR